MRTHPVVWVLRLCWLALPFTLGDALGTAVLDGRSRPVVLVGTTVAWALWAVVTVATLVAHPVTLTVLRVLAPAAAVAGVAALAAFGAAGTATSTQVLGGVGVALAVAAAGIALSGGVADAYVDAASYGDERRFALRVPPSFLVGPVPVFWVLTVGGCLAGPLLLAARSWVPGAMATLVGVGLAVPAARAFHGLSRRWLVMVPAGATLVDHLALVDPVLFGAKQVAAFGPALEGTNATDLTQGATGLVLELGLDVPVEITARTARAEGELQLVRSVLVSPVRPGAVLAEAGRRGLGTGGVQRATPPPTTSSPS